MKMLLMLTGVGATGMVHFLSEELRGPMFWAARWAWADESILLR